jgi:hypothetical protein
MKKKDPYPNGLPKINTKHLHQQKFLEAELMSLGMQIRNFSRIRDRLAADGTDANKHYTKLRRRQEELSAEFAKTADNHLSPEFVGPPEALGRHGRSLLLSGPFGAQGTFGLGSQGFVQMPPPIRTESDVVGAEHPMTGSIEPVASTYPSTVAFRGNLNVGPESIPADQYDPTIRYFWIRNWTYLIAFPPPPVESRFTYRFNTYAQTQIFFGGGEGQTMAFVSLGETNNLVSGVEVVANTNGGWPLVHDLNEPADYSYNGHYGFVEGEATVQRSFMVGAHRVPGVAIVVGAIEGLSMMAELRLQFSWYSSLSVINYAHAGAIEYSYQPVLVNQA